MKKQILILYSLTLLTLPCKAEQIIPTIISTGTITGKVILTGTTDCSNVKIQAAQTNLTGNKTRYKHNLHRYKWKLHLKLNHGDIQSNIQETDLYNRTNNNNSKPRYKNTIKSRVIS